MNLRDKIPIDNHPGKIQIGPSPTQIIEVSQLTLQTIHLYKQEKKQSVHPQHPFKIIRYPDKHQEQ